MTCSIAFDIMIANESDKLVTVFLSSRISAQTKDEERKTFNLHSDKMLLYFYHCCVHFIKPIGRSSFNRI